MRSTEKNTGFLAWMSPSIGCDEARKILSSKIFVNILWC